MDCGTQIRVSDAEVGIPTSDEIFIPDNHPVIISHEVLDAVQRRLSQQRVNHGDFSPSPDRYALTGLLWCGKCDQRMQGRCQGGYQFYMCGGAGRGLCTQNSVRQDKLLREIFGAVHTHLADPERLERFKQAVRRHENQGSKANSKATISRLENQIAVLEQKLDRAANRLILVDDEQLPSVQKQIGKLHDERDQLALQLSNAREPVSRTISDLDSQCFNTGETARGASAGGHRCRYGVDAKVHADGGPSHRPERGQHSGWQAEALSLDRRQNRVSAILLRTLGSYWQS